MKSRKKILSLLVAMIMIFALVFSTTALTANATVTVSNSKAFWELIAKTVLEDDDLATVYGANGSKATLGSFKYKDTSGELSKAVSLFVPGDNNDTVIGERTNITSTKITFNAYHFNKIADSDLQQCLIKTFAHAMNSKDYTFINSDRQAIYKEIREGSGKANAAIVGALFSDTKADMLSALTIFQPMNGFVGTLLGIGVIAILVLLGLSTALDIMYINFPIARNFMYGDKDGDKGGGDKGMKKPWGVTPDAVAVYKQSVEGGSGGKEGGYTNPNLAYFKRRALTYIIVAVLILYLLSGQIANLIGWLMDLVSGFRLS